MEYISWDSIILYGYCRTTVIKYNKKTTTELDFVVVFIANNSS
jgi:hypothetical protein